MKMNNEILTEFDSKNLAKIGMFSIYDKRSQTFGNVFCHQNDKTAKRYFTSEMSKLDKADYPVEDYDLYLVGFYDITDGVVYPSKLLLINAVDCLCYNTDSTDNTADNMDDKE